VVQILEVKKGRKSMNNYEAPTFVTIGEAHELILSEKPTSTTIDSEGAVDRANRLGDIDESDD
jgi:hypothetical protein